MIVERAFGPSSKHWATILQLDQRYMPHSWNESQWRGFDPKHDTLFINLEGDEVVGFALYRLSALEELAHLLKIALHPDWRGAGRGVQFAQAQFEWLRGEQFRRVYLEVGVDNASAIKLYTKLGFTKLRRVAHFYQDGTDALTMEKPLGSSI